MAFAPNVEKMEKHKGGGDFTPETEVIPEGEQPCQLVGYVELGKQQRLYKGQLKQPEMGIALTFEFGMAKYTGSFPLTISTTREWKEHEFFDWIGVSDKLASGEMSMSFANKTSYMKVLAALNAASDKDFNSIRDAVGELFLAHVVHSPNKKEGELPYANMSIAGRPGLPAVEAPVLRSKKTGKILEDLTEGYPEEALREYAVFEWDNPTEEAWKALTKWHKESIKKATNFVGSPIEALLLGNPDLDMPVEDKSNVDPNEGVQPPAAEAKETDSKLNSDAGGLG